MTVLFCDESLSVVMTPLTLSIVHAMRPLAMKRERSLKR